VRPVGLATAPAAQTGDLLRRALAGTRADTTDHEPRVRMKRTQPEQLERRHRIERLRGACGAERCDAAAW
jgi:hypothetical protein